MTVLNPSGRAASLRVDATGRLLVSGSGGGGAGSPANLSYTASTGVVANSNGTGFTIPAATTSVQGLLSAADKTKIDGGFPANLAYAAAGTQGTVSNGNGTGFVIPTAVAGGNAGLMTGGQAFSANRWVIVGRGPWGDGSTVPSAAANTGNIFIATDIGTNANTFGGTPFFSNGVRWYPMGGSAVLYQYTGGIGAPLATVTTVTGTTQLFTLPKSLKIPNGLLFPGASLHIRAVFRRSTPGSNPVAANGIVWLNNVDNQGAGTQFSAVSMGTVGGNTVVIESDADIYSGGYTTYPAIAGSLGTSIDRPMTVPGDAYVYCGVSASFETGALIQLLAIQVILKA